MHTGLALYGSSHRRPRSESEADDYQTSLQARNAFYTNVLIKMCDHIYPFCFVKSSTHAQVTKPPSNVAAVVWRD